MAVENEKVVLCKASPEVNEGQQSYFATLESAGYTCICLKTLQFEFININELRDCLSTPDAYNGIILTSRRAAEAIEYALKDNRNLLEPWKSLQIYCVGPATESFAKTSLGLKNCIGSESGNARNLAEIIIMNVECKSKPLLYPCSAIARETIQQIVVNNGIPLKKLIVYKTCASQFLENDLLKLIDGLSKIFVFFSPSCVEHIVKLLEKYPDEIKKMKAVAIGPITAQALTEANLEIYAVAEKPDPNSLLQAIIEARARTSNK